MALSNNPGLVLVLPLVFGLILVIRTGAHRRRPPASPGPAETIYEGIPDQATIDRNRLAAAQTGVTPPRDNRRAFIASIVALIVLSGALTAYSRSVGHELRQVTRVPPNTLAVAFTHSKGYVGLWFQCDYVQCVEGSPVSATVSPVGSTVSLSPTSALIPTRGPFSNYPTGTFQGKKYFENEIFLLGASGAYVLHLRFPTEIGARYEVIASSNAPGQEWFQSNVYAYIAVLLLALAIFEFVKFRHRRRPVVVRVPTHVSDHARVERDSSTAAPVPFALSDPSVARSVADRGAAPPIVPSVERPPGLRRVLPITILGQFACVVIAIYSLLVTLKGGSSTALPDVSPALLFLVALPAFLVTIFAAGQWVKGINDNDARRGDPPRYPRGSWGNRRMNTWILRAIWGEGDSLTHLLLLVSVATLAVAPLAMYANTSNPTSTRYVGLVFPAFLLAFTFPGAAVGVSVWRLESE